MRHTWSECGVDAVDVERYVDRRLNVDLRVLAPVLRFMQLHAESFDLFALVCGRSTDTCLDQSICKLFFHDSRKRRRM